MYKLSNPISKGYKSDVFYSDNTSYIVKKVHYEKYKDKMENETIQKLLKNEVINRVPAPSFIKEPVSNLLDKGVDLAVNKTGLGLKKNRKK